MLINLNDSKLEIKLKVWDAVLKGVTAIILICTAMYGVKTYLAQNRHYEEQRDEDRKQLIEQNKRYEEQRVKEFNTTIYKARVDIYSETIDAAAKFANAPNLTEAEKAEQRFWELYNGKTSVVENQLVLDTMLLYGDLLSKWDECKAKPKDGPPTIFGDLTYNLTQACRLSLMEAFPTQVTPLQYGPDKPPLNIEEVKLENEQIRNRKAEVCIKR